jgi:hypothetical protein
MKNVFLGLLLAGLVIANNGASTLAANSSAAAEACPTLPIRIASVTVSPLQPARRHTVNVSWEAKTPHCFTINKFSLKGAITFANGQKKGFSQTATEIIFDNFPVSADFMPGVIGTLSSIFIASLNPRVSQYCRPNSGAYGFERQRVVVERLLSNFRDMFSALSPVVDEK